MKYNKTVGSVSIKLDTSRIEGNLERAQDKLDQQVLADIKRYMPASQQHAMINATDIIEPGLISTNTPYAHYQYIGLLRTDEQGRAVVGEGKKKPILTDIPLKHSGADAYSYWFEHAKQEHGKEWLELVKREAGRK